VSVSNASLSIGNILRLQQTRPTTAEEYGDGKASKDKNKHNLVHTENATETNSKHKTPSAEAHCYRWPRNSQPLKKTKRSLQLNPILNQVTPVDTLLPTYT